MALEMRVGDVLERREKKVKERKAKDLALEKEAKRCEKRE